MKSRRYLFCWIEIRRRSIAGNEQRQFEKIAAVQRQTFHFRDSITPWTSESWLSINGALPTSAVFPVMAATSSGAFNVTVWPT